MPAVLTTWRPTPWLWSWLRTTLVLLGVISTMVALGAWSCHEMLLNSGFPLEQLWRDAVAPALPWLAVAPLIALAGERFPFGRLPWPGLLAVHLGLGTVLGAVVVALSPRDSVVLVGPAPSGVTIPLELRKFMEQVQDQYAPWWGWSVLMNLFVYLALAAIAAGVAFRRTVRLRERRTAQVERDLVVTELRALRAQLQPHFLFNALNGVHMLIDQDARRAREMVRRLSELLRATLLDLERAQVPLGRELELLRHYVALEHMRFSDRIAITLDVPAELEALLVPSFCLQPLVENAIRHGPGARPEGGAIRVTGRRHGPSLELAVTDDGPGLAAAGAPGCGTGIANTRLRLRALHGDQAQLRLERPADGGCRAVITLPATPEADPAMAAAPS